MHKSWRNTLLACVAVSQYHKNKLVMDYIECAQLREM